MTDLQFNEEQEFTRLDTAPQFPFIIRLALKTGVVQTERGAQYLLLAVAGALLLISLLILFSGGGGAPPENPYVEGQDVFLPPGAATPSF